MRSSGPVRASCSDNQQKQRIVAMVCGPPLEGQARWTVRLVTDQAVKKKLVPRCRPGNHPHPAPKPRSSSRGETKMWRVPELKDDFTSKMEDVLEIYERPYNPEEPVVCLDEKPVTLHADVRPGSPAELYPTFRSQHLFVGSGVIEAACKTVVGSRLKQSGMRWTLRGANSIIPLRCCHLNRRFENHWEGRRAA
jgi:hypothetical protein